MIFKYHAKSRNLLHTRIKPISGCIPFCSKSATILSSLFPFETFFLWNIAIIHLHSSIIQNDSTPGFCGYLNCWEFQAEAQKSIYDFLSCCLGPNWKLKHNTKLPPHDFYCCWLSSRYLLALSANRNRAAAARWSEEAQWVEIFSEEPFKTRRLILQSFCGVG